MPSAERGRRAPRSCSHGHGRVGSGRDGVERLESRSRRARASSSSSPRTRRAGTDRRARRRRATRARVVLGGDGTMLRALRTFLGTGVPVLGVNFGRVGFLSSIPRDELEHGLRAGVRRRARGRRAADARGRDRRRAHVAVNDVVVTSRRARPHGRARVGGRRRGPRPRPVRRAHLLDARPARPPTTSRTAGRC